MVGVGIGEGDSHSLSSKVETRMKTKIRKRVRDPLSKGVIYSLGNYRYRAIQYPLTVRVGMRIEKRKTPFRALFRILIVFF